MCPLCVVVCRLKSLLRRKYVLQVHVRHPLSRSPTQRHPPGDAGGSLALLLGQLISRSLRCRTFSKSDCATRHDGDVMTDVVRRLYSYRQPIDGEVLLRHGVTCLRPLRPPRRRSASWSSAGTDDDCDIDEELLRQSKTIVHWRRAVPLPRTTSDVCSALSTAQCRRSISRLVIESAKFYIIARRKTSAFV